MKLTREQATELLKQTTTQPHLWQHAVAVGAAMGAMARHFHEDAELWEAVGLLHDYDYEQHPQEHLQHTAKPLQQAGIDEGIIRAILSHGFGQCNNVEPVTAMEKSLFTVDGLTGLISATARMRPTGISDLAASSITKKFKDKAFAAGVNRATIQSGIEMLGIDRAEVFTLCIEGMKPYAHELGLQGQA